MATGQSSHHGNGGPQSTFHVALSSADCVDEVRSYLSLVRDLSSAECRLAAHFSSLLKDGPYAEIAGQFHGVCVELERLVSEETERTAAEVEGDVRGETGAQVTAKIMARVLQSQLRCLQLTTTHISKVSVLPDPCELASQSQKAAPEETNKANKSTTDSPSRSKKGLSSLLSKFSKSSAAPAGEAPLSAFYVNLEDKEKTAKEEEEVETSRAELMCEAPEPTLADNASWCMEPVASQDDLDLVIRVLSSGPRPTAMDSIPENCTPQHRASRAVGSHLPRHSEGALGGPPRPEMKTNTWPSVVGGLAQQYGPEEGLHWPPHWGPPNSDLHKWRGESGSRQWSTAHDSCSSSDESSSNGGAEMPLGHLGHRRRHSSGSHDVGLTVPPTVLHKSVESLLPSCTWPSRDPSLPSPLPDTKPGAVSSLTAHRPLCNQWSDPLVTHHMALWEPTGVSIPRQSYVSPTLPTSDLLLATQAHPRNY